MSEKPMKPANILSFSEISDQTCRNSYEKYLGINIKDEEFLCLKKFCSLLQAEHPSIEVYNNFYIGYNIPQISKEFDLLRIDDNLVIDIELKKTSTPEKIKKQLIQNQHYLSYLNRNILLVTFEKDTGSIYTLDKDNQLITIDINGLISALESQNHLYTGDLNKLFNPSNYLVSPFNSTGAFLDGKYFLTNQQEEFKTSVTNSFIGQEFDNVIVIIDNFFCYDGAKQLKSIGRPGNPYDQVKMLFQAMTRVKRKLEIVVINNQPVFGEILKLLS